jgi:hypothetical protein
MTIEQIREQMGADASTAEAQAISDTHRRLIGIVSVSV